ncbi:hypothetical protein SNE40_007704 [Patella caerulea]|uniref:Transmembrane protein 267 n=1 Tax=Patella caerulea TaxID=87958 RepID=A0AAN8JZJ9_PATCE
MTHGIVGFFSWAIVINFNFKGNQILSLLLCFFLALGVDLDHFIEAKSTDIKDAINLPRRPPFHKSTIIPLVSGAAALFGYMFHSKLLQIFSLLFTTAWLSHHIRDATRRGLWFPPIGSTPPIPYKLYLCLIMLIPLGIRTIYSLNHVNCKNRFSNCIV